MESWFCIWEDLANPKIGLNLLPNPPQCQNVVRNVAENNETAEHKVDKIYFYYLDYYYKGFPKIQSLAFLNSKRRNILELENEFIETSINNE